MIILLWGLAIVLMCLGILVLSWYIKGPSEDEKRYNEFIQMDATKRMGNAERWGKK